MTDTMKRFYGSQSFPREMRPTAVALGVFDGVHLGHRELLRRARDAAARTGGVSVAYTFEPHPVRVLAPAECPPQLTTAEQKLLLIERYGVDAAVVEPFTHEFGKIDPQSFFRDVIVGRLGAATLVAGYDFTFGRHRHGTIDVIEALGSEYGVETIIVPAIFIGETLISSTLIRRMISRGEVNQANELLGRPYSIEGTVVPGRGIGRELAARTANIESDNDLILQYGVYVTRTLVEGRKYASITSVGDNPTFSDAPFAIETHLIDVEADIMGKRISIEFLSFMREQIRFGRQEELRAQIARDIDDAREYHRGFYPPPL